jgi:hypothetical protein
VYRRSSLVDCEPSDNDDYLHNAVKALDEVFKTPAEEADADSVREMAGHFLDTRGENEKGVALVTP